MPRPKCLGCCNFASLLINSNFRLYRDERTKCNWSLCQLVISAQSGPANRLFRSEHNANEQTPKIPHLVDKIICAINFLENLSL